MDYFHKYQKYKTKYLLLKGGKKSYNYVGTSGFYLFKTFEEYASNFNSVEINNTFYKMPTKSVIKKWYKEAPEGFKFTIKMNAIITHYKKLKNVTSEVKSFIKTVSELKEKLGCILFQFPKNFKNTEKNLHRLVKLKAMLSANLKIAIEFRDSSWFTDEIFKFMNNNNWVLTFSHYPHKQFVPSLDEYKPKTDFVYFRLHGSTDLYQGKHSNAIFKKIKEYFTKEKYVYFNNTDSTTNNINDAVHDALKMKTILMK